MSYVTERYVPNFIDYDETQIRNGSPAFNGYMRNIADNQQWLALTDMPMEQFISNPLDTAGSPVTLTIPIAVPPGAVHCEFYFYLMINSGKSSIGGVLIEANTNAHVTAIPTDAPGWLYFNGVPEQDENTGRQVELVSSASMSVQNITVDVTIDSAITVYSAFYRVIPGRTYSA